MKVPRKLKKALAQMRVPEDACVIVVPNTKWGKKVARLVIRGLNNMMRKVDARRSSKER